MLPDTYILGVLMYRSSVLLTLPLSADNVMLDWGVKCVCVCNTYYYYEGNEGT